MSHYLFLKMILEDFDWLWCFETAIWEKLKFECTDACVLYDYNKQSEINPFIFSHFSSNNSVTVFTVLFHANKIAACLSVWLK